MNRRGFRFRQQSPDHPSDRGIQPVEKALPTGCSLQIATGAIAPVRRTQIHSLPNAGIVQGIGDGMAKNRIGQASYYWHTAAEIQILPPQPMAATFQLTPLKQGINRHVTVHPIAFPLGYQALWADWRSRLLMGGGERKRVPAFRGIGELFAQAQNFLKGSGLTNYPQHAADSRRSLPIAV